MSKLAEVGQMLIDDPQLDILCTIQEDFPLSSVWPSSLGQTFRVLVAPITELESLEDYQQLLDKTAMKLEPTCREDVCRSHISKEQPDGVRVGVLTYDESIGSEYLRMERIPSNDMTLPEDLCNGTQVVRRQSSIHRRIWVQLYPSRELAVDAIKDLATYRERMTFPDYEFVVPWLPKRGYTTAYGEAVKGHNVR